MHKRRRIFLVCLTLLLVGGIFLTMTGAALAQASERYDMACWGIQSGGGGTRTTSQHTVLDSFGQTWGVPSSSATYTLRPGYIQTRPAPRPQVPDLANKVYFPVAVAATEMGICSW